MTNPGPAYPMLAQAQVLFDRPADPFSPAQQTVDLYLYDVRENLELRSREPVITRQGGMVSLQPAPMRVACSFLVTAWAGNVTGDEVAHREQQLLGEVLQLTSRYPTIPASFLQGDLAGQDPPLPMLSAPPEGLKNPSEFWAAVGNKLRPSLTLTVTVSLPVFDAVSAPAVITEQVAVGAWAGQGRIDPTQAPKAFRVGGMVSDATKAPVVGASVSVGSLGLTAVTGADGRYVLGPMPQGTYAVAVSSGATTRNLSFVVPAASGGNYDVQL